jgi:hypothetical protein
MPYRDKQQAKAQKRRWREARREEIRQKKRLYYLANAQRIKSHVNSYRRANRDEINKRDRERYIRRREYCLA